MTTGTGNEWNFFVGCCCGSDAKLDEVELGGGPGGGLPSNAIPDTLEAFNAGLPYGPAIDARPIAVLTPGGPETLSSLTENVLQDVAPSERADVAGYLRGTMVAESYRQLPPGSTHAALGAIARRYRRTHVGAGAYTLNDFANDVTGSNLQLALKSVAPADRAVILEQVRASEVAERNGAVPSGTTDGLVNAYRVALHRASVGATSSDDTFPPSMRSYALKPFAHVKGVIAAAPTDLAARMASVDTALKNAGWTVYRVSVGTDFGHLGLPTDQPVEYLLHRTDRAYTPKEAESALASAIAGVTQSMYSPISTWAGEVANTIVIPTILQTADAAKKTADKTSDLIPYVAAGIVGLAAIMALK